MSEAAPDIPIRPWRPIPSRDRVAEVRQQVLQALDVDGWPATRGPGAVEAWPRLEEVIARELERFAVQEIEWRVNAPEGCLEL